MQNWQKNTGPNSTIPVNFAPAGEILYLYESFCKCDAEEGNLARPLMRDSSRKTIIANVNPIIVIQHKLKNGVRLQVFKLVEETHNCSFVFKQACC